MSSDYREIPWSEWLESMRTKDVESAHSVSTKVGGTSCKQVFESMELRPWTISGALAVPFTTSFLKWTALMKIGRKVDGQQDGGSR